MKTGRLICVMALILVAGTLFVPVAQAEEITIETIAERLRQWRSHFANVRLVNEQRNPEQLRQYHPHLRERENVDGFYHRMEWIWTDHGPGRMDRSKFDDGVAVDRQCDFTDGKLTYRLEYAKGAEKVTTTKSVAIKTPHFKPQATFWGVMSLTYLWFGSDQWLHEVLVDFKAEVVREESIGDARCVLIETHREESSEKIWLDKDFGFLPRRVEGRSTVLPSSVVVFEVKDFRELQPGVWFPIRGRQQAGGEPTWVQWKVVELEINATLPHTLFELPALSPGTYVDDAPGNRRYQTGESTAKNTIPKNPISPTPTPPAEPIGAAPTANRLSLYFGIGALLLALTGLGLIFKPRG